MTSAISREAAPNVGRVEPALACRVDAAQLARFALQPTSYEFSRIRLAQRVTRRVGRECAVQSLRRRLASGTAATPGGRLARPPATAVRAPKGEQVLLGVERVLGLQLDHREHAPVVVVGARVAPSFTARDYGRFGFRHRGDSARSGEGCEAHLADARHTPRHQEMAARCVVLVRAGQGFESFEILIVHARTTRTGL